MPLVDYYKKVVLENYANFSGRARRAEFWWFVLANLIIYVILGILMGVSDIFFVLYVVYGLAVLVPSIAVAVRRLHDTGKSGWFILIGLIPLVGFIILLVFYLQDSQQGSNEHGPSEKYPA